MPTDSILLAIRVGRLQKLFKDKKAIIYAKSVRDMASKYRKQLTLCRKI